MISLNFSCKNDVWNGEHTDSFTILLSFPWVFFSYLERKKKELENKTTKTFSLFQIFYAVIRCIAGSSEISNTCWLDLKALHRLSCIPRFATALLGHPQARCRLYFGDKWPWKYYQGQRYCSLWYVSHLSLIHIWRCRRIERCRSRWSPYH